MECQIAARAAQKMRQRRRDRRLVIEKEAEHVVQVAGLDVARQISLGETELATPHGFPDQGIRVDREACLRTWAMAEHGAAPGGQRQSQVAPENVSRCSGQGLQQCGIYDALQTATRVLKGRRADNISGQGIRHSRASVAMVLRL